MWIVLLEIHARAGLDNVPRGRLPRAARLHHGGAGQHGRGGDLRARGQRLLGAAAGDLAEPQRKRGAAEETAPHGAAGRPSDRTASRGYRQRQRGAPRERPRTSRTEEERDRDR